MSPASRIYVWFFVFLALVGSAVVLPKLAASGDTGLAAAGTAAITFLAFAVVALGVAVALLVMTLRNRATLNGGAKVVGLLPLPLILAGVIVMVVLVRRSATAPESSASPPPKATAPAP